MSFFAQAAHPIFNQSFLKNTGELLRLSQIENPNNKPYLVLFWANWCLPCKEEIKTVAENASLNGKFIFVAINTDEAVGAQKAVSFLEQIKWPYVQLRDEGGAYFYRLQKTGQLPFSLLLNGEGDFQESFFTLDFSRLSVDLSVDSNFEESKKPWTVFGEAYWREAQQTGADAQSGRAFANAVGVMWSSPKMEASIEHQLLFQDNASSRLADKKWEDKLGSLYGEWRSQDFKIRAGDDRVLWLSGELIYLQQTIGIVDPAELRGVHLIYQDHDFTTSIIAGRIDTPLFARELDPKKDVSVTLPTEDIAGVQVGWSSHKETEIKWNLTGGTAQYKRAADIDLGYPQELKDKRQGLSGLLSQNGNGVQLNYSQFQFDEVSAGTRVQRPHTVDGQAWLTFGSTRIPVHFLEAFDVGSRSLVPTLVEDPAMPLTGNRKSQWKIQPRWESKWYIEPGWTYESLSDESNPSHQTTLSFTSGHENKRIKAAIAYQETVLNISNSRTNEWTSLFDLPLEKSWSVQLRFKQHQGQETDSSENAVLGWNLSSLTEDYRPTSKGHWQTLLNWQWTHQGKYYRILSGVDETDFSAIEAVLNGKVVSTRLAYGRAPGGIVCTNGICTQKTPLNGWQGDFIYNIHF